MLAHVAQYDTLWQLILHKPGAGAGEQDLPAVRAGHNALHTCQGQVSSIIHRTVIHNFRFSHPCVDTHADRDGRRIPCFVL